eukprot:scaffold247504_cov18-Tisochrysis_lutea.AAC.3
MAVAEPVPHVELVPAGSAMGHPVVNGIAKEPYSCTCGCTCLAPRVLCAAFPQCVVWWAEGDPAAVQGHKVAKQPSSRDSFETGRVMGWRGKRGPAWGQVPYY